MNNCHASDEDCPTTGYWSLPRCDSRDRYWPFERGFRTYAAIAGYLNAIGVRTGHGRPISARTVRTWRQRGLPITTIGKAHGAWTSNVLLLAWLASYGELQRAKPRRAVAHWYDAPPRTVPARHGDGWERP